MKKLSRKLHLESLLMRHNLVPEAHTQLGIRKGKGVWAWDEQGRRYLDCVSGWGALNHGYTHSRILAALSEQCEQIALAPGCVHSTSLGLASQLICTTFGYDKALLVNTPAEALESAVKLARRWGYEQKGIPRDQARILFAAECRWEWMGLQTEGGDPRLGPEGFGFRRVEPEQLPAELGQFNVAAVVVEPVGKDVRPLLPAHLKTIEQLCRKHNVLLIVDETQSGMGRTGALLAQDHAEVKADIVCLGKALGGGFLPIAGVCGTAKVFANVFPGWQFLPGAGSPMACAALCASISAMIEDGMAANAACMGDYLQSGLSRMGGEVRGSGLLLAVDFGKRKEFNAHEAVRHLLEKEVLTAAVDSTSLLVSPPLLISKAECAHLLEAFESLQ